MCLAPDGAISPWEEEGASLLACNGPGEELRSLVGQMDEACLAALSNGHMHRLGIGVVITSLHRGQLTIPATR